jgi:hypothetical protein
MCWVVLCCVVLVETERGHSNRTGMLLCQNRDPESIMELSDALYGDANLIVDAFTRALGDQGVLVTHMGAADMLNDDAAVPLRPKSDDDDRVPHGFINGLVKAGFESIFVYTESPRGRVRKQQPPWTFVVALQDANTRARWFRNEAHIQLDLHQRTTTTTRWLSLEDNNNEVLPFRFFDGATFMAYQFPNRLAEETWCRNNNNNNAGKCENGHGFDPAIPDRGESSYRVARSSVANGGRGVFATEHIPKGGYLGNEECVNGIFVPPHTFEILDDLDHSAFSDATRFWTTVYEGYIQGYVSGNILFCSLRLFLTYIYGNHTCLLVGIVRAGRWDTTYVLYVVIGSAARFACCWHLLTP